MHPGLVAFFEDTDPVTYEMLISVAKTFQVWPAPKEITYLQVTRNGNMWYKTIIFLHQFAEDLLNRRLVNNIHINGSLCTIMEYAKIFQKNIEWFEFGRLGFNKPDHFAIVFVVISEERNMWFRSLFVEPVTDEIMDVVLQDRNVTQDVTRRSDNEIQFSFLLYGFDKGGGLEIFCE